MDNDKKRNIILLVLDAILLGGLIFLMSFYGCREVEDDGTTFGGPVVAPTEQQATTTNQPESSFGGEKYIWDDWKLNDGL